MGRTDKIIDRWEKWLSKFGLKIMSYKPDRVRLYQIVRVPERGGVDAITPYMEFRELKNVIRGMFIMKRILAGEYPAVWIKVEWIGEGDE